MNLPHNKRPAYWYWLRTACQLLIQETFKDSNGGVGAILIFERGEESNKNQEFAALATCEKYHITPVATIKLIPTFFGRGDSIQNLISFQKQLHKQLNKLNRTSLGCMVNWLVINETAIELTDTPTVCKANKKHVPILELDGAVQLTTVPIKEELERCRYDNVVKNGTGLF